MWCRSKLGVGVMALTFLVGGYAALVYLRAFPLKVRNQETEPSVANFLSELVGVQGASFEGEPAALFKTRKIIAGVESVGCLTSGEYGIHAFGSIRLASLVYESPANSLIVGARTCSREKIYFYIEGWRRAEIFYSHISDKTNTSIVAHNGTLGQSSVSGWRNPRPRTDNQCVMGALIGAFSGVRRFLSRARLPGIYDENSEGRQNSRFFPRWGALVAPIGAMILLWGWNCIRNERNLRWGSLAFVGGAIL